MRAGGPGLLGALPTASLIVGIFRIFRTFGISSILGISRVVMVVRAPVPSVQDRQDLQDPQDPQDLQDLQDLQCFWICKIFKSFRISGRIRQSDGNKRACYERSHRRNSHLETPKVLVVYGRLSPRRLQ